MLTFLKETDIWTMHPFNLIAFENEIDSRQYVPEPPSIPDEKTQKEKDFNLQKWLKENPTKTFKRFV